jgi:hypothetical protein
MVACGEHLAQRGVALCWLVVCWLVVDCGSFAGPTAMTRIPRGLFAFVLYYWAIEKLLHGVWVVFFRHTKEKTFLKKPK